MPLETENFHRQGIINLERNNYIPVRSDLKTTNKILCANLPSRTLSEETQDQEDKRRTTENLYM